jgi:hypothetical protein
MVVLTVVSNNERQLYTKQNNIAKNQLTITAKRKGIRTLLHVLLPKVKKNFNTVVLRPEQLPVGQGVWPALDVGSNISEVGWPNGEIDILEYKKRTKYGFTSCTLKTVTEILLIRRKPDLITSRKVFMCTRWNGPKKIDFL